MKSKPKKPYNKPQILAYGSMEQLTQQGGSGAIDGIIGITGVPGGISVTTGSL